MSCNKCEGQVRYDPVKKILLYKWGCDWLPLPNSALGSLPDAPPPGEDELPDLPDLPDGDSSQNYACRKASVIMSVIYEKAGEILTYATENNFTDFVKRVGLGNTTDVSRSLKAIYDAQLDPVTFALYTDYIANEDILTDHICAISEILDKTPGLTEDEYAQIASYIDSLASLARNILRLAKARLSLVEANRMAQAAAFDESVPCPCGSASPSAPPPALPDYDGCKVFDFKVSQYDWTITDSSCTYVAGQGFVATVNKDIGDATITYAQITSPTFDTRKVTSVEIHYDATLGLNEGDYFNTYRKGKLVTGADTLLVKNTEAGQKRLIWYGYKDISQFYTQIIAGVNHDTQGVVGGQAGGTLKITKIIIRYEGTDPAQLSAVPDCQQ